MNCPICGCAVTYEGLNNLECAGSTVARFVRTGGIGEENCPNYRAPAEVPESKPVDMGGAFGWFGPGLFTLASAVPASAPTPPYVLPPAPYGTRAWAIQMYAAAAKYNFEWRVVSNYMNGVGIGVWRPLLGDPSHPMYDNTAQYTTEWRLAP